MNDITVTLSVKSIGWIIASTHKLVAVFQQTYCWWKKSCNPSFSMENLQKNLHGFYTSELVSRISSINTWLRFSSYSSENSAHDTWPARTNTCDGKTMISENIDGGCITNVETQRAQNPKLLKCQSATKNKKKNIINISETSKIERKYVFSSPIIKGNHFYSFGRTVWEIYSFFHKVVKNSENIIFNTKLVDRGLGGHQYRVQFCCDVLLMPSCICKTISRLLQGGGRIQYIHILDKILQDSFTFHHQVPPPKTRKAGAHQCGIILRILWSIQSNAGIVGLTVLW